MGLRDKAGGFEFRVLGCEGFVSAWALTNLVGRVYSSKCLESGITALSPQPYWECHSYHVLNSGMGFRISG